MKKNVLQFIGSFHQGGSERQAVTLSRALRENGEFNILVATLNRGGALLPDMECAGFEDIPEFKLNSFYDANFVRQLRRCVRFLRENRIDIVHTHDFYTNVFGMFAASIARTQFSIASKRETGGMRTPAQERVEKIAFKLSDRIVANSAAVRDYLMSKNISADKIDVIYNGFDLERLGRSFVGRSEISRKLGLPVDGDLRFITLVANLRHEVKNQPMFLRVAKRVIPKIPGTHFILAGEGELQAGLENLARDLGIAENVHFIGRCDMVADLLSISFACVLTSVAEGFSNSIIEYMAAGKPVVATDVGGAREAIIEDETGYLVASDDDGAMAERLIEFLTGENKARTMGEAGKRRAEEKFSRGAQLERTLALYRGGVQ